MMPPPAIILLSQPAFKKFIYSTTEVFVLVFCIILVFSLSSRFFVSDVLFIWTPIAHAEDGGDGGDGAGGTGDGAGGGAGDGAGGDGGDGAGGGDGDGVGGGDSDGVGGGTGDRAGGGAGDGVGGGIGDGISGGVGDGVGGGLGDDAPAAPPAAEAPPAEAPPEAPGIPVPPVVQEPPFIPPPISPVVPFHPQRPIVVVPFPPQPPVVVVPFPSIQSFPTNVCPNPSALNFGGPLPCLFPFPPMPRVAGRSIFLEELPATGSQGGAALPLSGIFAVSTGITYLAERLTRRKRKINELKISDHELLETLIGTLGKS